LKIDCTKLYADIVPIFARENQISTTRMEASSRIAMTPLIVFQSIRGFAHWGRNWAGIEEKEGRCVGGGGENRERRRRATAS
jgi:hypothetical protein